MSNPKELTIRDLESSPTKGSIFVINNTKGASRSQLFLTVPKSNGEGNDGVVIPVTFIPMDLTEQVTKKQLMESSAFRRLIARRLVRVIDDESALEMLREPEAQAERDRILNELNADVSLGQQDTYDTAAEVVDSGMPEGVAPGVVQVIELLKGGETEESAAVNTIRSMGELESEDYRWILNTLANTNYEAMRAYATKALSQVASA